MIVELQCLANPAGTPDDPYRHIEAAIAVIQSCGFTYEVRGPSAPPLRGSPTNCGPSCGRYTRPAWSRAPAAWSR